MSSDTVGSVSLTAATINSTEPKVATDNTSPAARTAQADSATTALNDKFISDSFSRTAQAHQADGLERATRRLEQLDSDSDGFLTREELQNLRIDREKRGLSTRGIDHLLKHFDLIDVGGDHKISADEMERRRRRSKQVESSISASGTEAGSIVSNATSATSGVSPESTAQSAPVGDPTAKSTGTSGADESLPTLAHDKELDLLIADATKPALAGPQPDTPVTDKATTRAATIQSPLVVDSNTLLEPVMGTLMSQSGGSDLDNAVQSFLSFKSAPKETANAILQASGLKTKG